MLSTNKRRPTRGESRAHTREKLLASAREVFAQKGYHGASVDLIAEHAGFSKGAVYSNFESKEAVFLTLLERTKGGEIKALEEMLTNSNGLDSLFERMSAFYAQVEADVDWGLISAEFQVQAGRDPEFSKKALKLYRRLVVALGRLIAQLFEREGRKPPLPAEELAAIFMALSVGLALRRTAGPTAIRKGLLGDSALLILKNLLATAPQK